jgi:glucose-6-phosphate 1-epimerase
MAAFIGQPQVKEFKNNFTLMEIINSSFAKVSNQGGHLIAWKPAHANEEVIFCSTKAIFEDNKAIRGGVPICWPWFGPKEGASQHGFARNMLWSAKHNSPVENHNFQYLFESNDATLALWPHPFKLLLDIDANDSLNVSLTVLNTGQKSFEFTSALHAYFTVGDIMQIEILGLEDCTYEDKITGEGAIQSTSLIIEKEIDRIYQTENSIIIVDQSLKREIIIESFGTSDVVVWNPWIERSKTFADLGLNDYKNFVCIEPGCISAPIELLPGEEYSFGLSINLV